MANAVRGEIALVVDGEPRILQLSINALCDVESATGLKTGDLAAAVTDGGDMTGLRALLWGALRTQDDRITLVDAGDIIAAVGVSEVRVKLTTALAAAFPPPSKKGAGQSPPASPRRRTTAGTGKSSSSAG